MAASSTIAAALAEAARTIDTGRSLTDTLSAIAESARFSVPGFEHVGISTVDHKGHIQTRAATDEIVTRLDDLQLELDEGPCMDALRESHLVEVPDIRHDQRWPRYVGEAVRRTGLQSQMAVQLYLHEDGTLGGLNMYSTENTDIHPEAPEVAELFAAHAAIALGHARLTDHLTSALKSSRMIGQAIGIIMERYQINADQAFAFLTRASSHSNTKIRDIAEEIVRGIGAG